ncbi:hypothetical protein [Nocardia harenae]|uniref:hypothetical protein n=1 Tax=Nocardia harenae TaxID=358707 RepID=UPI00082A8A17|nr:hypothetical protein [Nocardia harenae]
MKTTTTTETGTDPFDAILTGAGLGLLYTGYAAALAIKWAVLFPVISAPLAFAVLAGVQFGWPVGLGLGLVALAGIMLWRHRRPEMFERWVTARARTRFLTWWRYTRRWARLLTACNLTIREGERVFCPRLLSVAVGASTDVVRLGMLAGQSPADFENRAEHLAHAFGADATRVTITGPAVVELSLRYGDSLAEVIDLPAHSPLPGELGSTEKGEAA